MSSGKRSVDNPDNERFELPNRRNLDNANQPGKTNLPLSFFLASAHLQAIEAIRKGMLGKGRPPILRPTIIHKKTMGFVSVKTICSIWLIGFFLGRGRAGLPNSWGAVIGKGGIERGWFL